MTNETVTLDVLVADDEEAILKIFRRLSDRNKDTAELVGTTLNALELLNQGRKYDLVFTDLNQNPTGIEVYKEAVFRGIEAYIISGGSDDPALIEEAQRLAGDHFIQKPFELSIIMNSYAQARAKKSQTPPPIPGSSSPLPSTSSATPKGVADATGGIPNSVVDAAMIAADASRRLRPTVYDNTRLYRPE